MSKKSDLTRIERRKRLDALFDRGSYVRLGSDGNGVPVLNPETESDNDVVLWVSPPTPLQREMAVREAQAARARALIEARDRPDSPQWSTVRGYVYGLSMNDLIDFILDLDQDDLLGEARRDVLVQKEWDDFNQLRDAMRQYEEADDPDDEQWDSLKERDQKFGNQVNERLMVLREDARAGYQLMAREALQEKAIDRRIEQAGSGEFMVMYEQWMLFYSVRDETEHTELAFDTPNDIKMLPETVQAGLASTLADFINDSSEAKN